MTCVQSSSAVAMADTDSQIEEIPRSDTAVPDIRLKIINLNISGRGRSLSPPQRDSGKKSKRRCADQRLARRRIHKLRSYEHLVRDLPLARRDKRSKPCQTHIDSGGSRAGVPGDEGGDSVYLFFVQGFKNVVQGDEEQMLSTILELLSEQAVSVARHEPLFLCEDNLSREQPLQHAALHGALLALNEVLDPGVLDISRSSMVGLGQCLTVTVYFHDQLAALSRHAWYSSYAKVLRDAWMGFGCVGAMVIMSSMRQ